MCVLTEEELWDLGRSSSPSQSWRDCQYLNNILVRAHEVIVWFESF